MYILAIETTGKYGSVALINEENRIIAHESTEDEMNHLTGLMPMIKKVLEDSNVPGEKPDIVACDIGPGSFTGIRIGVSTARALAQTWNVKAISVSGLSSFLMRESSEWDYSEKINVTETGIGKADLPIDTADNTVVKDYVTVSIYNARRRQVYGFAEGYLEEGPWIIDDIIRVIKEDVKESKVLIYGDGIDAYSDIIKSELGDSCKDIRFAHINARYQDAVQIARAALEKYKKGETCEYFEMLPDYMRQAEAEQKLKAGELPICRGPKQE